MTQQLWQASKMVTMGELAASVAHEINNPLAILSLRVESLEAQLPDTFAGKKDVEIMGIEIERMASLVSNMLQFSRSGQRHLSSLDVREELDNTLELVHSYLVHRHIEVREEITPTTPLVIADRQQMRQLFLNLITNASDAMPEGGTLKVDIHPGPDGSQVMIELQDTGVGIDPRDLPRVVEPFFTTKPEGKGTGLGLAICRRIVEEHQGSFQVTSPGKDQGATVRLSLPCSHPETSLVADTELN
jgi:signal transduction histidine kinase